MTLDRLVELHLLAHKSLQIHLLHVRAADTKCCPCYTYRHVRPAVTCFLFCTSWCIRAVYTLLSMVAVQAWEAEAEQLGLEGSVGALSRAQQWSAAVRLLGAWGDADAMHK